jgi:ribonucleoside-diphosphate reductase alpha chain
MDFEGIEQTTRIAVRLLDNVIDASQFPLPPQAENARGSRRIGLGMTGLADAMVTLGVTYGSSDSLTMAADVTRHIRLACCASQPAGRDRLECP